ncbi:MAG: HAD family hydrolase [Actinomycetales bacterium]|nr:HAD family hydrolase [Actinomycetales bacterium]
MAGAAAFFDLDKTILATSAAIALSGPLVRSGLVSRVDIARSAQAQLSYLLLDASHERTERMKEALAEMVTGWSVADFDRVVADALATQIEPIVFREALDAISTHHAAGHDVVIVSASAEAIVRPIMHLLGADGMIASRLEVADGRYTGVISSYNYGEAKPAAMAEMARHHGWDLRRCWAYSDSITDEPLLRAVGHPVAVNPDRALARIARREGWEVRIWRSPVPLGRNHRSPFLVTAVTLAAVVLAVWAVRRARR